MLHHEACQLPAGSRSRSKTAASFRSRGVTRSVPMCVRLRIGHSSPPGPLVPTPMSTPMSTPQCPCPCCARAVRTTQEISTGPDGSVPHSPHSPDTQSVSRGDPLGQSGSLGVAAVEVSPSSPGVLYKQFSHEAIWT